MALGLSGYELIARMVGEGALDATTAAVLITGAPAKTSYEAAAMDSMEHIAKMACAESTARTYGGKAEDYMTCSTAEEMVEMGKSKKWKDWDRGAPMPEARKSDSVVVGDKARGHADRTFFENNTPYDMLVMILPLGSSRDNEKIWVRSGARLDLLGKFDVVIREVNVGSAMGTVTYGGRRYGKELEAEERRYSEYKRVRAEREMEALRIAKAEATLARAEETLAKRYAATVASHGGPMPGVSLAAIDEATLACAPLSYSMPVWVAEYDTEPEEREDALAKKVLSMRVRS